MLGLYLHIPFCIRKCAYCDFNTYAGLQTHFQATVDALCAEMARWRVPLHEQFVHTIFIGGGTPTVLNAEQLTQLLTAVHTNFQVQSDAEITCEANPGAVDRPKFQVLRDLGVNRLSLGVQSFQPAELQFLERVHGPEEVVLAYEQARAAGFTNINLDFIFGLPNQPLTGWQATLEAALQLRPEHLSLYSLIVEPNTPLHHWVQQGQVSAPDEELAADQYEFAQVRLAKAGYVHYEVSNWAVGTVEDLPGTTPKLASQHNLVYWRNQPYVGIGPGAHSHWHWRDEHGTVVRKRWGNRKPVPGYIKRIQAGAPVEETYELIDDRTAMGETMMVGLRLVQEGVPFARFAADHGVDLRTCFADELATLTAWGLLESNADRVRLTPRGLMVGNQVFARFLPG
jgi:oxygen-independent coproporphyrinogen-3 oxidase